MRPITLLLAPCLLSLASAVVHAEPFYCQPADYAMIYNISSGFDAEIADDVPSELVGRSIATITLWGGEWFYGGGPTWQDPLGLRVNLYAESCPPEQTPFLSIETPWAELDKTLVVGSGGMRIYELRVTLPEPLTIAAGMSLGATMLIDWGSDEPFTGLCATPMYQSYGACVAYLDALNWGYTRWTAIDHYTGIAQDLGYCLTGPPTAVETPAGREPSLASHPNPFNPTTTIRFAIPIASAVRLTIHDARGRRIASLIDADLPAGDHEIDWRARAASGRDLPSGVYLARLSTALGTRSLRLVLLR